MSKARTLGNFVSAGNPLSDGTIAASELTGTLPVANGGTGVTTSTGTGNVVLSASPTLTGDVTLNAQGDLRFADADSSNWVAFQAPTTVASNVTWTLPAADGTTNQVLSTNGSGALSWATASGGSGMTLLSTTTLSGSGTNIGVASGYVHLYIVAYGVTCTSNYELYFRITGLTSAVYDSTGTNSRSTSVNNNLSDTIFIASPAMASALSSSTNNVHTYLIENYDNSSMIKIVNMRGAYVDNASTTQFGVQTGLLRNTSAISSVTFFPSTGSMSSGTVLIYGVK